MLVCKKFAVSKLRNVISAIFNFLSKLHVKLFAKENKVSIRDLRKEVKILE